MSQVRVAKGIPNQPLLKQTRFSNSLAKQKNTKKYLRTPKKITKLQLNTTKKMPKNWTLRIDHPENIIETGNIWQSWFTKFAGFFPLLFM